MPSTVSGGSVVCPKTASSRFLDLTKAENCMKRICACCGGEVEADGGLQEALDLFERVAMAGKPMTARSLKAWLMTDNVAEQIKRVMLQ
jgi:hypothetical protein